VAIGPTPSSGRGETAAGGLDDIENNSLLILGVSTSLFQHSPLCVLATAVRAVDRRARAGTHPHGAELPASL
jgi:hypothetical protein